MSTRTVTVSLAAVALTLALAGCQTPGGGAGARSNTPATRGANSSNITDPKKWAEEKKRAGAVWKMNWAPETDPIMSAQEARDEFKRVPDLLCRFEGGSNSQWTTARRELRDMGKIIHPQILEQLGNSESPDLTEAAEARAWLARIGKIFTLLFRFNERSIESWGAARRALSRMGDDAINAMVETLLMKFRRNDREMWGWARQELVQVGSRVAEPTYYVMASEKTDRLAKVECAKTLSDLGPAGEKWLMKSLEIPDWRTRYAVAAALGEMPQSRSTLPVLQHLLQNDPEWQVRGEAAAALGKLESPATVPALLKGLNDSDPLVQRNCIQGLGTLREKRAIDPLVALIDRTSDQRVTQMICWALYRTTGRKFSPDMKTEDLKTAVYDPEGWKRWWVAGRGRSTP